MLRIGFVTLFPEVFETYLKTSMMGRAVGAGAVQFQLSNPRDFATDRHRKVDDSPYGGGPGMVMMAPLIEQALEGFKPTPGANIILTDPTGEIFTQETAQNLAKSEDVIFICGHYEGVDERVRTQLATHVYSIGDFVLTGGELPALVMTDAIVRLLDGVLGDPDSHKEDSHSDGLLGFPAFTRPPEFRGESVPEVLLSGNHAAIKRWRRKQQLVRTRTIRPDLWVKAELRADDLELLKPDSE